MGRGAGDGGDIPGASSIVYGVEISYESLKRRVALDNAHADPWNWSEGDPLVGVNWGQVGLDAPSLYELAAQALMGTKKGAAAFWDVEAGRRALEGPFRSTRKRDSSHRHVSADAFFDDLYASEYFCGDRDRHDVIGDWLSSGLREKAEGLFPGAKRLSDSCTFLVTDPSSYLKKEDGPEHVIIAYLPGTECEYYGKDFNAGAVRCHDVTREEDLDPARVYAFRKIVQDLLIPAGLVDADALNARGGPRFLHAKWTLEEHC